MRLRGSSASMLKLARRVRQIGSSSPVRFRSRGSRNSRAVAVPLKAGTASFHHPLMVHGSYANSTDRPRRATVLNFCKDGTRSDSPEPLLQGVDPIAKGEPVDGQFFPLLRPALAGCN